jgi:hypothetical protein
MNVFSLLKESLHYLVPLAAIALTFCLGRYESRITSRKAMYMKRYETFYAPYLSLLCAGMMWERNYSELSVEARSRFFDLVFQNIACLGDASCACLPGFYKSFLDMFEYSDGNPECQNAPRELDAAFNELTARVLSETTELCKALSLPKLSKSISEFRRE